MHAYFEIACCETFLPALLGSLGPIFSALNIDKWSIALRNVLAIFGFNTSAFWDNAYRAGYWDFLRAREQRPRHYAVAGIVKDANHENAAILEIGCGFAPVLTLLHGEKVTYTGLDLSQEVIQKCRAEHVRGNARFIAGAFENANFAEKFDIVIASEVLYYYPLSSIFQVSKRLLGLLKPGGILVVTMNKNPKAAAVWLLLSLVAKRRETIVTMNERGSRWTVCVYERDVAR